MRSTTMAACLALSLSLAAPVSGQAMGGDRSGEEAEVLQVVTDLFDGMREKDEAKLRRVFHPAARLHSTGVDAQGVPGARETPVDGFIRNILNSPAYLDEVTFDEEVRVDGAMAMAWTPYNLFVNEAFQHCGVDVFVLVRGPDGWQILQIADTRTREGCDPERRG